MSETGLKYSPPGCESCFTTESSNFSSTLGDNYTDVYLTGRAPKQVPEPPVYLVILATVFYVLIFVVGVLGNIAVIVVVIYGRAIRTAVNMYLTNLCVADLLVMVICMPPVLVELHTREVWYFGEFMCKLVPFLEIVVASASVFTIIAISFERFRVVYKPLSVTNENVIVVGKVIGIIWVAAIVIGAPMLVIAKYKDSRLLDGTPIKVCRTPIITNLQCSYIVASTIMIYVIPCFLLFTLYFQLCRKLIPDPDNPIDVCDRNFSEKQRLRRQVINIIATIVFVFFICHLPYRVVSVWLIFEDSHKLAALGLEGYLNIVYFSRIILYVNHALNPILYNFVSSKFRGTMKMMFISRCRRRNFSSHRRVIERRSKLIDTNNKAKQTSSHRFRNGGVKLTVNANKQASSSSSSSSKRQHMNDFSPLYANIAQSTEYELRLRDSKEEPFAKLVVDRCTCVYITKKEQGDRNNSDSSQKLLIVPYKHIDRV